MGCDGLRFYRTFSNQPISIHAARVGCDLRRAPGRRGRRNFNPRSPSGLRRSAKKLSLLPPIFQSTQPEWAATVRHKDFRLVPCHISIHAARVGCDGWEEASDIADGKISIHAARVGCDFDGLIKYWEDECISIHAARVGCDMYLFRVTCGWVGISIHAARVGCDARTVACPKQAVVISIHAARVGCDIISTLQRRGFLIFQSTQPEWAATRTKESH